MTTKPARSPGRWIAAWIVAIVLGAFGILIALADAVGGGVGDHRVRHSHRRSRSRHPDRNPPPRTRARGNGCRCRRRARRQRGGSARRSTGNARPTATGSARPSARAAASGSDFSGRAPGPFDNPPEEEVELDPDHLPWESARLDPSPTGRGPRAGSKREFAPRKVAITARSRGGDTEPRVQPVLRESRGDPDT